MISFIVAVYNKEKYLKECVDSILAQDNRDFELILVDDGSTDSSAEICDNYAAADRRIRVFHTENHGPGAARNKGIEEAGGDYLAFVDADDWIEPDFLSSLTKGDYTQYDVIFYRYIFEYSDGSRFFDFDEDIKEGNDLCADIIRLNGRYNFESNCSKLVKTSLVKEHGIRYKQDLRTFEDWIFTYDIGKWVKKYLMINAGDYHARYDNEDIGHLSKQRVSLDRKYEIYRRITAHAFEMSADKKWADYLYARMFIMIDGTLLYSGNIKRELRKRDKPGYVITAWHYLKKADITLLGFDSKSVIKYRFFYFIPFNWWFLLTYRMRRFRMERSCEKLQ